MREVLRRVGAIAFALLLVSTVVLSGAMGPASPVQRVSAEWSEECDLLDSAFLAAYNTIVGNGGCRWVSATQEEVENLTSTDAYASGLALKDSADSYTTTTGNFMQNTRTVAMSKAKITLINELNNGSAESVAQDRVNETIRDYYSRIQASIIKDWNAKATQIIYLNNTSVGLQVERYTSTSYTGMPAPYELRNQTYTLANGSTMVVKSIGTIGQLYEISPVSSSTYTYAGYVEVEDNDTGSWTPILYSAEYGMAGSAYEGNVPPNRTTMLLDESESQEQYTIDNMDPYVDAVYAQYAAGEISSTDLALSDPSVIAAEASTSLESTGYYSYAAIQLAAIGAGGNINTSHTIQTGDGTTLNGTLYYTAQDTPETGWQTNETYNITDYNGTFYFVVQKDDGNASVVDLSNYGSTFTITEAVNTNTGEEVNTTVIHRYVYESTNASALAEEIDRLRELRQLYKQQALTGGGGGSGGGLGNTQMIGVGVILALLVVVVLRN